MIGIAAQAVLWVVTVPAAAAATYLALLATASLPRTRRQPSTTERFRRFAVVVPAHNEAAALPDLITSLRALDYPGDRFAVTVVADNCTDDTAEIAREASWHVVERHDDERRGKGYALAAALDRLSGGNWDAVVFVDGDCTVSPNLLRSFDRRLDRSDVVQAYYTMRSAAASSTGTLRLLALTLVHLVRPLAVVRLGGSAGLKGSGMCFSRAAIDELGWSPRGLAEDIEQHVVVLRSGRRVDFAPEAIVLGQAPSTLADASGQHRRWEAGRVSAARAQALPLLSWGLRLRRAAPILAAIELIVPPISVIVACLLGGLAAAALLGSAPLVGVSATGLAAMGVYVAIGFVKAGSSPRDIVSALARVPAYVVWKTALYARTLVVRPTRWEPTRRD